jgi:alpha-tubulin suppressor-like RCC1 family protein/AmiR/NasT family two-component response regulator
MSSDDLLRDCESNHVLVVDDTDTNVLLVEYLLRRVNVEGEVTCCDNAADAIALLRESPWKFSLLLLDVEMPEMNGIEAALAIRRFNEAIPIVALTAFDDAATLRRCLDAGMDGVASKPFREASIAKVVATHNGRRRAQLTVGAALEESAPGLLWGRGFFLSENPTLFSYLETLEDAIFKPKTSVRIGFLKSLSIDYDPDAFRALSTVPVKDVAAGEAFTVVALENGKVQVQGSSLSANWALSLATPTALLAPITHVSAGRRHMIAWAVSTKFLYSWGENNMPARAQPVWQKEPGALNSYFAGQLGRDSSQAECAPGLVKLEGNVIEAACGAAHTLVLTDVGLFGFGLNQSSQLAQGPEQVVPVPKSIFVGNTAVSFVACGAFHSLLVNSKGSVFCWGWNAAGQCGVPQQQCDTVSQPTLLEGLQGIVKVAGGSAHSLALANTGKVFSWGSATSGQLGRSVSGSATPKPGQVEGPMAKSLVCSVSCGAASSAATDDQGSVWVWGCLQGEGYTSHAKLPRQATFTGPTAPLQRARKVTCGAMHVVCLMVGDGIGSGWLRSGSGTMGPVAGKAAAVALKNSFEDSASATLGTKTGRVMKMALLGRKTSGEEDDSVPRRSTLSRRTSSEEDDLVPPPRRSPGLGRDSGDSATKRKGGSSKGREMLRVSSSPEPKGGGDPLSDLVLRAKRSGIVTALDQTLIDASAAEAANTCALFHCAEGYASPRVLGAYSMYAERFLSQNHFLFVSRSAGDGCSIVAVLRLPDFHTHNYVALAFNRFGIHPFLIDAVKVLGWDCGAHSSPRDLGIKLLTYFINYGCFEGYPPDYAHLQARQEATWFMAPSHTKSPLPSSLLLLECRLGLAKRLVVGVICNLDSEPEEDAVKNPKNSNKGASFARFCNLLGDSVPRANWSHWAGDGDRAEYIFYTSWRGFEIVFHRATDMTADEQRQFIGNAKCLIVFRKSGPAIAPVFRGSVNSLAVVVQWLSAAEVPAFQVEAAKLHSADHGSCTLEPLIAQKGGYRCAIYCRASMWNFQPTGLKAAALLSSKSVRDVVLANVVNGHASATTSSTRWNALFATELDAVASTSSDAKG